MLMGRLFARMRQWTWKIRFWKDMWCDRFAGCITARWRRWELLRKGIACRRCFGGIFKSRFLLKRFLGIFCRMWKPIVTNMRFHMTFWLWIIKKTAFRILVLSCWKNRRLSSIIQIWQKREWSILCKRKWSCRWGISGWHCFFISICWIWKCIWQMKKKSSPKGCWRVQKKRQRVRF